MICDLTDLPLFAWHPTATVLPFPAAKRHRLVRETAVRLLNGDQASFVEAMATIEKDLAPAGLISEWRNDPNKFSGPHNTWPHVWAFHEAVQVEIRRLDGRDTPQQGQGR